MTLNRILSVPRRSRNVIRSLLERHADDAGGGRDTRLDRLTAIPPAVQSIWQARGDILDYLRTGDDGLAFDLRRRFGLGPSVCPAHLVPDDLFGAKPAAPRGKATLVIPVYNAHDDTARLLAHLGETLDPRQKVILVDDGSDDPRVRRLTAGFARAAASATLLSHARNAGFVAAVNTGLAAADRDGHVILLNTDALPPADWIDRLLAPFAEDDRIASVTPLSNHAEILSIPRPGIASVPDADMVALADGAARQLRARRVALPTGIGFCMALNRRFLDRIGGFDAAFGRGYGEEVDWCRKAALAGGRNVVATNLFVGHRGGASFGAEERRRQVARAGRMIAARYPSYPGEALDWDRSDPIGPERLAVSLAWAAATASGPVPVFVAHSLGGGAETALSQEIARQIADGTNAVVVLRVGGPEAWRVELRGERFTVAGDVRQSALMHRLLAPLASRHVVYSCAVGAAEPAVIPDELLHLAKGGRLDIRVHDFFPVSPSWNLLGSDGQYRGIPPTDDTDPAHAVPATVGHPGLSHTAWRAKWSKVIGAATEITVFAPSGRDLFETAYPDASRKIVVRPHRVTALPRAIAPGGQAIGVLGGINRAKGAHVLERLAAVTRRGIAVIGEMDGQFRLPAPHVVHGRYEQGQIAALAERYGVGLWFIPSICPETFSFACHEALATGLPVVSFDIGAQAGVLRAARRGHVLRAGPEDIEGIAAEIERLFA